MFIVYTHQLMNISPANDYTIRQILNVNYSGEFGASNLYKAQIIIARILHKDLVEMLLEIKKDETHHCLLFKEEMKRYNMVPCKLTWIWGVAGFMLGFTTALLGRRALLLCINAAELTAHKHLESQIHFLNSCDTQLADVITAVNIQEEKHSSMAGIRLETKPLTRLDSLFHSTICKICNMTMWIVTRGESTKLDLTLEQFMESKQ